MKAICYDHGDLYQFTGDVLCPRCLWQSIPYAVITTRDVDEMDVEVQATDRGAVVKLVHNEIVYAVTAHQCQPQPLQPQEEATETEVSDYWDDDRCPCCGRP